MEIEAVIAELGTRFTTDEAIIAEKMLTELFGTIPHDRMISEIGLAIAIHRWDQPDDESPLIP